MEISKGDCSRAFRSLYVDRRLERRHGYTHVRRIRRDALVACPKNCEHTVAAGNGGAAGSRFTLIAWHCCIAEVHAAGPLQQVSGGGCHVSDLPGGPRKNGLR